MGLAQPPLSKAILYPAFIASLSSQTRFQHFELSLYTCHCLGCGEKQKQASRVSRALLVAPSLMRADFMHAL